MVLAERQRFAPWFKPVFAACLWLFIFSGATWAFLEQFHIPHQVQEISAVNADIAANRQKLTELNNLKKSNDSLNVKKRILDCIIKKSEHWSTILDEIRNKTPNSLSMEAIVFDQDALKIVGKSRDFVGVSELAANLNQSENFSECIVESATRADKNPEAISFVVVAKLKTAEAPTMTVQAAPNAAPANVVDASKASQPGKLGLRLNGLPDQP